MPEARAAEGEQRDGLDDQQLPVGRTQVAEVLDPERRVHQTREGDGPERPAGQHGVARDDHAELGADGPPQQDHRGEPAGPGRHSDQVHGEAVHRVRVLVGAGGVPGEREGEQRQHRDRGRRRHPGQPPREQGEEEDGRRAHRRGHERLPQLDPRGVEDDLRPEARRVQRLPDGVRRREHEDSDRGRHPDRGRPGRPAQGAVLRVRDDARRDALPGQQEGGRGEQADGQRRGGVVQDPRDRQAPRHQVAGVDQPRRHRERPGVRQAQQGDGDRRRYREQEGRLRPAERSGERPRRREEVVVDRCRWLCHRRGSLHGRPRGGAPQTPPPARRSAGPGRSVREESPRRRPAGVPRRPLRRRRRVGQTPRGPPGRSSPRLASMIRRRAAEGGRAAAPPGGRRPRRGGARRAARRRSVARVEERPPESAAPAPGGSRGGSSSRRP